MSGTIHRFMAQLFHICTGLRPHRTLSTPQQGIPDSCMDKLSPPSERHYTRDPHTRQFTETQAPQEHVA